MGTERRARDYVTLEAIDRTSAQPQVKLSFLCSLHAVII
jgi:hypothetical protein